MIFFLKFKAYNIFLIKNLDLNLNLIFLKMNMFKMFKP